MLARFFIASGVLLAGALPVSCVTNSGEVRANDRPVEAPRPDDPVEAPSPAIKDPAQTSDPLLAKTRIGLIDMGYVFRNSDEFTTRRKQLEKDIAVFSRKDKEMAAHVKSLQEAANAAPNASEEQQSLKLDLIKRNAEYQSFRTAAEQKFARREAELFLSIYQRVEKIVGDYARETGLVLVNRFERERIGPTGDLKKDLKELSRGTVYFHPGLDISEEVLVRLNRAYAAEPRKELTRSEHRGDDRIR